MLVQGFKQFNHFTFLLLKGKLFKYFIPCSIFITKATHKQILIRKFSISKGYYLHCFIIAGVLLLCLSVSKAQPYSTVSLIDKPFILSINKNPYIIKRLEENSIYNSSSSIEKDFIYWTNFARLFPHTFCDSVLIPFTNAQPSTKGIYAQSLIADFKKAQALPFLIPVDFLTNAARHHSKDLVNNRGIITHQSSDGTSFAQRMKRAGVNTCAAENLSMGHEDPLVSLLLLYLDIGLLDAGHRLNLLNPGFTQIGVSIRRIPDSQYITVQDFACSPR